MRDSPAVDTFGVETDELEATIEAMQRCEDALEQRMRDVESEMTRLHGLWHGDAAEAHRLAQAEWQRGLAEMRAALTAYRRSARLAHGNYVEAARANARMWVQTR